MSDVIQTAVEEAEFVYDEDRVATTDSNTDTGQASARIKMDSCLTADQVEALRASDLWELHHVHPNGDGVDVHIIETLEG